MRRTMKTIGLAAALAALTAIAAACGPDDRMGTGSAEQGVGAGTTTTIPRANPAP